SRSLARIRRITILTRRSCVVCQSMPACLFQMPTRFGLTSSSRAISAAVHRPSRRSAMANARLWSGSRRPGMQHRALFDCASRVKASPTVSRTEDSGICVPANGYIRLVEALLPGADLALADELGEGGACDAVGGESGLGGALGAAGQDAQG